MNKVESVEIRLNELLGTDTLRHRETAQIVLRKIANSPESSKIVINFMNISFVSRSFFHELLKGLRTLKIQDVLFVNENSEIKQMRKLAFSKPRVDYKITPIKKIELLVAT